MARRKRRTVWITPVAIAAAVWFILYITKSEFGARTAILAAIAILLYVAVVFVARRKIH